MSLLGRHPDWQSIIIRTPPPPNSFSKISKTGENLKNPLYIRYNLKIRYISKIKIDFQSTGCVAVSMKPSGQIMHAYFAPVLHAVKVALPVFCQQSPDIYR